MQPLQRLFDTLGNEVALFPLEYINISQGEHQQYAIDFLGWGAFGRVFDCPCYAPFSGHVVSTVGTAHNMIYWSFNPVRLVDGTLSDLTLLLAHSNTPAPSVGTSYVQGQLFYHTGIEPPATGDHLHLECSRGHVLWDLSGTHLDNPAHLWNTLAINDTVVIDGEGYDWRDYQGGVVPPEEEEKKHKFPWYIYRQRRNLGY